MNLLGTNQTSSTSAPSPLPADSLPTIIVKTAQAAQTQTSAASSPTPSPTVAPTETLTITPTTTIDVTSTIFIFEMQTSAAAGNPITFEVNTPFTLATQPSSQNNPVCSCNGDTYNCKDFSSHSSAQECYEYCISQNTGDIHRLDGDNDGIACENESY